MKSHLAGMGSCWKGGERDAESFGKLWQALTSFEERAPMGGDHKALSRLAKDSCMHLDP
jgi:hypothetical protein